MWIVKNLCALIWDGKRCLGKVLNFSWLWSPSNYRYLVDAHWNVPLYMLKIGNIKESSLACFHESHIAPTTRSQQSLSKFSICKPTYACIKPPYYFQIKMCLLLSTFKEDEKNQLEFRTINWIVEWFMCLAIQLCMWMGYSYGVTSTEGCIMKYLLLEKGLSLRVAFVAFVWVGFCTWLFLC